MISHLEVENFKSVKHLRIDCKKINIFIGEPNTGKSNILETLGMFSIPYGCLHDFIRFESMSNLFYDENLEDAVKIGADEKILEISFEAPKFKIICREAQKQHFLLTPDYTGEGAFSQVREPLPFKFFKFMVKKDFPEKTPGFLLPPSGGNLLTVLMTNKKLKSTVSQIFAPFGLRLTFKPQEGKIEVLKQQEDIFITYPYSLVSETLQRIVFYLTAIKSNKNSILIFEEPESHAFPYYTKFLAEKIALDECNNQYFISTHNPYFLLSVLEKSPKDEIGIFVTYFKDYQTRVVALSEQDLVEVLDKGIDLFFNIERFVEGNE